MPTVLFQILAVLHAGPADAAGVLDELRRLAPRDVPSLPAFYRHLRTALDERWVEIVGSEQRDEGAGRPGRRYGLTEGGRRALQDRARDLSAFTRLAFAGPRDGVARSRRETAGKR